MLFLTHYNTWSNEIIFLLLLSLDGDFDGFVGFMRAKNVITIDYKIRIYCIILINPVRPRPTGDWSCSTNRPIVVFVCVAVVRRPNCILLLLLLFSSRAAAAVRTERMAAARDRSAVRDTCASDRPDNNCS